MDVFDTYAKLSIDTSDYDKGLENAGKQAGVFADVLNANLVTKGIGVAIDAFKKLGEAAVDVYKESISAYADYEQLVGGVETLFKSSSNTILQYADEAYKNAGLSANEYLETVTSFSASLIQSTGRGAQTDLEMLESTLDEEYAQTKRYLEDQYEIQKKYWDDQIALVDSNDKTKKEKLKDARDADLKDLKRSNEDQLKALKEHNKEVIKETETLNQTSVTTEETLARAADLANMAIVDMSDNANKMGTTMESLQNAYNGFAKQNFTMLDNLKLGYGGTKQEMQRLMEDAEALMAKQGKLRDFSVDSYADIVEAIHIVQTEMGITGTTADEAEKTISGSVNTLKASWHNLIKGIADDNADMDKLINEFVDAADKALDNLIPVAQKAFDGLIELGIKMLPKAVELGVRIAEAIAEGILKALLKPLRALFELLGVGEEYGAQYSSSNFRASGGWMNAGESYIVGEEGPELITPTRTSYVHNAGETAGILGGNGEITININGDVYDDQNSMRRKLKAAMLGVLQEQMAYG